MTPAARKAKAKQLAGLMEALDIRHLMRQHLALQCLDAELPEGFQNMYKASEAMLSLVNELAIRGPLKYAGSEHRLKQPAE